MNINQLIADRVVVSIQSDNRIGAYQELANTFKTSGVINDVEGFLADIEAREAEMSTALGEGVSIPHARTRHIQQIALAVGISQQGIDCNAPDESKSHLFFMIATPEGSANAHIDALAAISRLLIDQNVREKLMKATTKEEVLAALASHQAEESQSRAITDSDADFVVAVTACPTGIAHTYMAEESLKSAAAALGVAIKVETNGTDGVKNQLTENDIQRAKAVIIAADRSLDTSRFNGKPLVNTGTKEAINKGEELITRALSANTPRHNSGKTNDESAASQGVGAYKHLLTGVSYMLPFVVSGGILIALAFLFDRLAGVTGGSNLGSTTYLAGLFMQIGGAAFGLFVPVLGAYIAYSISDRSAITAGFVGGALAVSGGSGFLGAILAGFLAGYATKLTIQTLKNMPKSLHGMRAILLYPLITVFLTGIIMILLLNPVVKSVNEAMITWLDGMGGTSRILLGIVLGGMMAVDMGGPINKAAYVFGTGTLAAAAGHFGTPAMAAVMAGGMVPPLGIAIATTLFKNRFNTAEREAGKTNYILGLSFITEGAIPFAAGDPIRVIPACIAGSALAGALSMFFNVAIPAPHGGLVVVFLSNHITSYILSILAGAAVTAILLGMLKKRAE